MIAWKKTEHLSELTLLLSLGESYFSGALASIHVTLNEELTWCLIWKCWLSYLIYYFCGSFLSLLLNGFRSIFIFKCLISVSELNVWKAVEYLSWKIMIILPSLSSSSKREEKFEMDKQKAQSSYG